MPIKRKIKIELSTKEAALVQYEKECGRNASIRRQANILYYAGIGCEMMKELCEKTGNDKNTIERIIKLYETMGVDAIYVCQRGRRPSRLDPISDELEYYFDKNPPSDAPEAVRVIRERFGINITVTPVKNWLKAKAIRTEKQKAYLQKQT